MMWMMVIIMEMNTNNADDKVNNAGDNDTAPEGIVS